MEWEARGAALASEPFKVSAPEGASNVASALQAACSCPYTPLIFI